MKIVIAASLLTLMFASCAFAQNKSVYTPTSDKICKASKTAEHGDYVGICPGTGGYKLELLEGDLRQTLNVITPAKKKFELNFWGFYTGFSAIGDKIEWRTKTGVPVAIIARLNVAGAEDSTKNTSYLMVAKISKTDSCVVDVIMPGAKQNEEARISADAASTKPCKKSE